MAIEDILRALDEQADAERDEILARAGDERDAILSDARDQAARIRSQRLERVKSVVEPKAQQLVNGARLKNKRDLEAARAAVVTAVFDEARVRLQALRNDPSAYEPVLRALIQEAMSGSDGVTVAQVDPADAEMAAGLVDGLQMTCSLESAVTPGGGVTVLSCAGRIARRNTMEDRLELVRANSSAAVAEMLFE
jgi:vacuolar-type H+-ATPase subunit E/Vma4